MPKLPTGCAPHFSQIYRRFFCGEFEIMKEPISKLFWGSWDLLVVVAIDKV